MKIVKALILSFLFLPALSLADEGKDFISVATIDAMILPGTSNYLKEAIDDANNSGAKGLVVYLNTPGGMLTSSQAMIQDLFKAPIPVVVFVSPSGGMAASAGVFITMAGHIAAMSPGTSIGAAHPVNSDGKDIEGDLRKKAENITTAMVKSIAEQRGRNIAWAEKAVRESSSLTEKEALKEGVIDFVANDINDLLRQMNGKEIKLDGKPFKLGDWTKLEQRKFEMNFRQKALNVLANPQVAALLWLGATTGIAAELYNPGLIFPGVVGAICLVLALLVTEAIPMNTGAIVLVVLGGFLLGLELYVPSGVLAIGGIIAMMLGLLYLFDVSQAPDLQLALEFILPTVAIIGGFFLLVIYKLAKSRKAPLVTGSDQLIGKEGKVISGDRIFVNGENWKAVFSGAPLAKGDTVIVESYQPDTFSLVVKKKE